MIISPDLKISYISKPNVENVVNPPNKPIIKNSLTGNASNNELPILINNPKIKQPKKLTKNVDIGNKGVAIFSKPKLVV